MTIHGSLFTEFNEKDTQDPFSLQNKKLLSIDMPNAGTLLKGGTRELLNAVLVEYAREEPVYRLDGDLLRKLPPGKRIGSTTIEDGRVVVHLAQ